jgi:hypothetical protein
MEEEEEEEEGEEVFKAKAVNEVEADRDRATPSSGRKRMFIRVLLGDQCM